MPIIKIVDGFSFIPRAEQTLLEALEREGVAVEFQCREGFCGSCQVALLEGEVEYVEQPIAFIPDGKVLPCCCRATTDVTLELPNPPQRCRSS